MLTSVPTGTEVSRSRKVRSRFSVLSRRDKVILAVMVGVPSLVTLVFIWLPVILSILLSFTSWNGIGGIDKIKPVGLTNYVNLLTKYQAFWPALEHNLLWLGFFLFVATPIGIFLAVLLDKEVRGTRFYQSVLYMPVVLSLAIVGFIWQLQYSSSQGFINNLTGHTGQDNLIDWLGNPNLNLWAIIIAAAWRHVGYITVLYLAGLKSVDPTLREAAAIDGANQRQTFFRVVFPVMAPINVVIVVITVIESLRAFDIAYITNKGLNGLELLSVLVTNNIIGEASLVGFGSAIGVVLLVISVGPIIVYLSRSMRDQA
jgi:ABC-type sugar transport system permease subunit